MHDTNASDTLHPVLGAVLRVMAPLVRWLLRSGVGYAEFTAAIKPVFLAEARAEVRRIGRKETDSALEPKLPAAPAPAAAQTVTPTPAAMPAVTSVKAAQAPASKEIVKALPK